MLKSSERGIIHILALLILLAGIVGGVYLVQHPTFFKPKAFESIVVQPTVTVIEVENPIITPEIEKVVANEFYKNHEDKYDFLGIIFDFNRRQYYHRTVKNNILGIGSQNWKLMGGVPKLDENPIFDKTAEYGSKGKLLGIGVMGIITDFIEGTSTNPAWIEEVIGHQFGVFVGDAPSSSDPLPVNQESWGHWN